MEQLKSIEQLENDFWDNMDFPTPLVEKCFNYRKIPVKNLSIEQVRLLLGQSIGVRFLLPIALEFLQNDILSEGDFYPGDLLSSVLRLEEINWGGNDKLKGEFKELVKRKLIDIKDTGDRKLIRETEIFLNSR